MSRIMPTQGTGRCYCGAVRYAWRAPPLWAAHCHCESCRRQCSAPFTSFFGVMDGAWDWIGDVPRRFDAPNGVRRHFCGTCGTPMAYAADRFPGEIHFYAASMDRPEEFCPTHHVHTAEQLGWVHLNDTLPRHQGTSE